jgi:phosphotransferase system enzyme I (PtsI)
MAQGDVLVGIGVGARAVRAEVFRLSAHQPLPAHAKTTKTPDQEIAELGNALSSLESLYAKKIDQASGELVEILQAQLALATDPELSETAQSYCQKGWNAPTAIQLAMNEFKELLAGVNGEFGERVADLDEIVYRLIQILLGNDKDIDLPTSGRFIVVATDLTPMDTVAFTDVVVGVITEKGGPTSHTAIVCRSRAIPALVACPQASSLRNGEMVLLDPDNSQAIVGGELTSESGNWWDGKARSASPVIKVLANIGSVSDAARAQQAQGVGLLRTELFFLDKQSQPTFEEQVSLYYDVFSQCPEGEIIVRTLDAGSDKPIPFLNMGHEENPALGVRGQRVAAIAPVFYHDQLRAIQAAADQVVAAGSKVSVAVMAPMIATIEEARIFADQARQAGIKKVGIMIEVPAIVPMISHLQGVIDFVSVGTNDLSQYLFAADRVNSGVAHLLNPWEPALLVTLSQIATACKGAAIKSGVCGESASDPLLAVVLAGLGFDSVSASPSSVDDVMSALSVIDFATAKSAADKALLSTSAQAAKKAARGVAGT